MTLSDRFVAAGGSVTGRVHRRAERDGQDGYALVACAHVVAAIVTDGCGSGRSSELGARLGAAWLAALVEQRFHGVTSEADARAAAREVTAELVGRLEILARSLDADGHLRGAIIDEALLFTFLAAVVTPSATVVFGIGDGVVVVDAQRFAIDPGPDNAPPYAAYGLFGAPVEPRVHFVGPTARVDVLAVGTDGLDGLDGRGGRGGRGGESSLPDLAADPRYGRNPSLLRKRLVVLSDQGRFSDDATLGVVRRREVTR